MGQKSRYLSTGGVSKRSGVYQSAPSIAAQQHPLRLSQNTSEAEGVLTFSQAGRGGMWKEDRQREGVNEGEGARTVVGVEDSLG